MNDVPRKKHFTRRKSASDGSPYWYIPMKACMLYESASLEFSTKVGGAIVGRGSTEYNHKLLGGGTRGE